ncbi:surfeit locus protein 6 homolog [Mytilus edulis]|uniref:surfeit locus protein 6 homolog n=1 Tax=Mytilus edulis TaxID=6550 RepID=UPI0039F085C1
MATAERGHTSEMDNSPRDEEMINAIKRRTREIYRVKTGKASETPQRPVQRDVDETGPSDIDNIGEGSTGNDLTMQALWDKISNMADVNKRQIESHTEIIANLAANMLTVQDAVTNKNVQKTKTNNNTQKDKADNEVNLINNNNQSDLSDNGLEDISDDDDDELNIDDIVDANDDAENKAFLDELEKMYEEPKKFGDSIDNQMAKLVDQAINKPIKNRNTNKVRGTVFSSRKL